MPLRLKYPVILASASPRRQELLRELVTEFRVVAADLDEDDFLSDDPWQTAQVLAREKAMHVFESNPDSLVIGGDTVVALSGPLWRTVTRVNAEINAALKLPEVRAKLEAAGIDIQGGTPQDYAALIKSDLAKWGKVVKEAGIALE